LKKEEIEKKEKWNELNEKMENLNLDDIEKEKIKRDILHKEAEQMRLKLEKTFHFPLFFLRKKKKLKFSFFFLFSNFFSIYVFQFCFH